MKISFFLQPIFTLSRKLNRMGYFDFHGKENPMGPAVWKVQAQSLWATYIQGNPWIFDAKRNLRVTSLNIFNNNTIWLYWPCLTGLYCVHSYANDRIMLVARLVYTIYTSWLLRDCGELVQVFWYRILYFSFLFCIFSFFSKTDPQQPRPSQNFKVLV